MPREILAQKHEVVVTYTVRLGHGFSAKIAVVKSTMVARRAATPRTFAIALQSKSRYSSQFSPFLFSLQFHPLLLSGYLGAATRSASCVAKEKNMEKAERLIRTWVATQQEALITEIVAGNAFRHPNRPRYKLRL